MDIGDIKYLEVPAKVTKLSEAIRIGAKIRPQGFTDLFADGKSCALGAAYEGATGSMCANYEYGKITKQFPVIGNGSSLNSLGEKIYRMNDYQRKTREQIADWLAEQGY